MFVDLYLIRRFPSTMGALTYHVPEILEKAVAPGSLVRAPIKKSVYFGVVKRVHNDTPPKHVTPADIIDVVNESPVCSEYSIAVADYVASLYHVYPGLILRFLLPPLQVRKLKSMSLTEIVPRRKKTEIEKNAAFYSSVEKRNAHITSYTKGKTLIIVPEIDRIESLVGLFENKRVLVSHSDQSTKEQFATWVQIRNNEYDIIIGTRGAVFLPFQTLDTIILDEEHHGEHKHSDQTPRYHVKDILPILLANGGILHYLSYVPSVETYYHIYRRGLRVEEKTVDSDAKLFAPPTKIPTIIDMRDERRAGRYGVFSDVAKTAIVDAKKDVLLLLRRKGFATSVGCSTCGFVARCSTCDTTLVYHENTNTLVCHYCGQHSKLFESCPTCHAKAVVLYGAGTELIERGVRALLGDNSARDIVRIDSESGEPQFTGQPRVLIGTPSALRYVRWDTTDTVILPDIDRLLFVPEYTATEEASYHIHELLYRLPAESTLFLQTYHPDHVVFQSLKEGDRLYRMELSSRKTLLYPPYTSLIRCLIGNPHPVQAQKQAEIGAKEIEKILTTEPKYGIVYPPVQTYPTFYRGMHWYSVIIKVPEEKYHETLIQMHRILGTAWRIDPRPNSISSI